MISEKMKIFDIWVIYFRQRIFKLNFESRNYLNPNNEVMYDRSRSFGVNLFHFRPNKRLISKIIEIKTKIRMLLLGSFEVIFFKGQFYHFRIWTRRRSILENFKYFPEKGKQRGKPQEFKINKLLFFNILKVPIYKAANFLNSECRRSWVGFWHACL